MVRHHALVWHAPSLPAAVTVSPEGVTIDHPVDVPEPPYTIRSMGAAGHDTSIGMNPSAVAVAVQGMNQVANPAIANQKGAHRRMVGIVPLGSAPVSRPGSLGFVR
jgi:hypothetical protein